MTCMSKSSGVELNILANAWNVSAHANDIIQTFNACQEAFAITVSNLDLSCKEGHGAPIHPGEVGRRRHAI